MVDVVLCLGSNLGDRASNMRQMETGLERMLMPPLLKSRLLETEPLGAVAGHPWYYNRLLRGKYGGTPYELLAACQALEKALGRTRPGKYAPRTADIDIVLFGEQVIAEHDLVVPHRRILDRRFCLEGLAEIAGDWTIPGLDKPARVLLKEMGPDVKKQILKESAAG